MKQISLIINFVLVLAVAALFILFFSSKSGKAEASSPESVQSCAGSGSIVYIQMDTLVNNFDMFNDLKSELESKGAAIQNDLNKKSRAFENDAKDFENKISKGLLTRSQAETEQNALLQRQQELQTYSQQKQMEIAEEETVMFNQVMDAIQTYVEKYNKEKKYALILTSSSTTNTVLSGDATLNITQDILNGINKEYIENRNK